MKFYLTFEHGADRFHEVVTASTKAEAVSQITNLIPTAKLVNCVRDH